MREADGMEGWSREDFFEKGVSVVWSGEVARVDGH